MTTITCPECGGRGGRTGYGSDPPVDRWIECEHCDGEGTIEVPTTQADLDELGIPADARELEYPESGPAEDDP